MNYINHVVLAIAPDHKLVEPSSVKHFYNKDTAILYADKLKKGIGLKNLVMIWSINNSGTYYNSQEQALDFDKSELWYDIYANKLIKHLVDNHKHCRGTCDFNGCNVPEHCPLTAPGGYSFVKQD